MRGETIKFALRISLRK